MFSRLLSGFSNCAGKIKMPHGLYKEAGSPGDMRQEKVRLKASVITYSLRNRLQYMKKLFKEGAAMGTSGGAKIQCALGQPASTQWYLNNLPGRKQM